MLTASPTRRGTGISLWGDTADLRSLHATVHKLVGQPGHGTAQPIADILMGFAFEVRKAYSDQRLQRVLLINGAEVSYLGFNLLWTDMLVVVNATRFCAGRVATTKADQAQLFQLESICTEAMHQYDPKGAKELERYVGHHINLSDPLTEQLIDMVNLQYLRMKPSITRFRTISKLFDDFLVHNARERSVYLAHLAVKAVDLGCEVRDLELDQTLFPEVRW